MHQRTSRAGQRNAFRRELPGNHLVHKPADSGRNVSRVLHRPFVYQSANQQKRFEQEAVRLADLVAPSAVTLLNDAVEVTVRGEKRYQRYYEVIGFAPDLLCGWQEELTIIRPPHDCSVTLPSYR